MKTVFIIPCYNESSKLDAEKFINFLENFPDVHLLFVDDGSTDQTFEKIKKFQTEGISILRLEENVGKGEAIRSAILKEGTNYEMIGYLDADLSTTLDEMMRLRNILESNTELTMVFGSRLSHSTNTIIRRRRRHLSGRIIASIINLILRLEIYDTQCGAKIFRKEFSEYFEERFISRWLFDVEVMARYKQKNGVENSKSCLKEVYVEKWEDRGDSKIKFKDILKLPVELLKIGYRYR